MLFGCRAVKVITNKTEGDLVDPTGSQSPYVYAEVTNMTASTITISFNSFPEGGMSPSDAIPIPANGTRNIPMAMYNFIATGNVTIVAYKP